ncbi:MAG: PhnD/SsuA/transferrin family substrate-binding protein [Verrucomicrobiota bacterium]
MTFPNLLSWSLALLLTGGTLAANPAAESETAFCHQDGERLKPGNAPLKLVVGVNDIYCKDSSCKCIEHIATRQYGEFCRKLKEAYNIDLQFIYFLEPYDLDRAFRAEQFDAVLSKPWLVFRHPEACQRMVRVADLQDLHRNTGLWGIVIVPKDSPLKNLGEIAGHRIAYGQSDAYEKHQGALALFKREGITIPADKLVEKASCLECIDLLMKGSVDAAVISNYALTADCAVDITTPDAFRVLGKTEEMPLTSFMIDLRRVSRADACRVQQALCELSKTELPPSMSGGGFVKPASWKVPGIER